MSELNKMRTETYKERVLDFAKKWILKFSDKNIDYVELVDHFLADDCKSLDFEMDCGKAFSEKYKKACNDVTELKKIIGDITDIKLLGSAIYSRWRYFNHWAYSAEEILEPENVSWFICVFERLIKLTDTNIIGIMENPKKISLQSNNISFGHCPECDEIVEQHLTVNSKGQVWFFDFSFGDGNLPYKKVSKKYFRIAKEKAKNIIEIITTYFKNDYIQEFATDIGGWKLHISDDSGKSKVYLGSLCCSLICNDFDISDLLRNTLGMPNLFAFDGRNVPDIINKITVKYEKLLPPRILYNFFKYRDKYKQKLVIDRVHGVLENTQKLEDGSNFTQKIKDKELIENLLDEINSDDFLKMEDDKTKEGNCLSFYSITIDYEKIPSQCIKGNFDKDGLPLNFSEFIERIRELFYNYGLGDIFDETLITGSKPQNDELIFLSVKFDELEKSYYYLTDDESVKIGDIVVVPVGQSNKELTAEVVKVEYFKKEFAPMQIEKVKHILYKK